MRLAAFTIAASLAAVPAVAQPLPAPASFPPVSGAIMIACGPEGARQGWDL